MISAEGLRSIPDALPRAAIPNPTRSELVQELHATCASSPHSIFLRGSIVRGDVPYGDIDLLLVTTATLSAEEIPGAVLGIPVSPTFLTPEQLMHHCQQSPRAWYLLTEHIKLGKSNPEVNGFLDRFTNYFISHLQGDYALYLAVEHQAYSRRQDVVGDSNYYGMKRIPGSKRSLMRGIFMAKTLYPDLYAMNSSDKIIEALMKRGLAPETLHADSDIIGQALAAEEFNSTAWQAATSRVSAWVDSLLVYVTATADKALPQDYVSLVKKAASSTLTEDELDRINTLPPHRRWTALTAYTANPNADPEQLMRIWQSMKYQLGHKYLERFLMRNSQFPVERIDLNEVHDPHSHYSLGRRAVWTCISGT